MIKGMGSGSAVSGRSKPPLVVVTLKPNTLSAESAQGAPFDFSAVLCRKRRWTLPESALASLVIFLGEKRNQHQLLALASSSIRLAPKHINLTSIYRTKEWKGADPTRDESIGCSVDAYFEVFCRPSPRVRLRIALITRVTLLLIHLTYITDTKHTTHLASRRRSIPRHRGRGVGTIRRT